MRLTTSPSSSRTPTLAEQERGPCALPHVGNLPERFPEPGKLYRIVRANEVDTAKRGPTQNNCT